jgi:hypothetical protein
VERAADRKGDIVLNAKEWEWMASCASLTGVGTLAVVVIESVALRSFPTVTRQRGMLLVPALLCAPLSARNHASVQRAARVSTTLTDCDV